MDDLEVENTIKLTGVEVEALKEHLNVTDRTAIGSISMICLISRMS